MGSPFFLHSYSIARDSPGELEAAEKHFGKNKISTKITDVKPGDIVVPRFRFLPFARELEEEIHSINAQPINSYYEHRNIANILNWFHLLEGLTPSCYTMEDFPYLPEGEYFLKGETNSKKNSWYQNAYAPNKKKAIEIALNLQQDLYLSNQTIVIRPFQHYRKIFEAVDGRPVFHERRVFILDGKVLSEAFYWSSFSDEIEITAIDENKFTKTRDLAINKIKHLARFLVIDFAEYPDGSWGIIELNDGAQSGLSENDPNLLWKNFCNLINQ